MPYHQWWFPQCSILIWHTSTGALSHLFARERCQKPSHTPEAIVHITLSQSQPPLWWASDKHPSQHTAQRTLQGQ